MSHEHDVTSPEIRAEALESLLSDKGLIDPSRIDGIIERFENDIGPMRGAQIVARAWTDPDYRERLLADG
ncbi:MAG: nitrile hydratase subunit alpha, partial [Thermoanaerobaculia bacterium]|nr:nitrile hydratase subunit alpha [Thermoanaerobaculia bacterium]